MLSTILAAVAALALGVPALAAPPAAPDPVMAAAQTQLDAAQAAILDFYPADAKAKGIEGEATLDCRRTPHGALTGCHLDAETPAGAGFGEAALAIAQRSHDDPTVAAPQDEVDQPHPITFTFRRSPTEIEPNVLLPQVIQPLAWLDIPPATTRSERYYPERAARMGVPGRAILDCYIGDDGRLTQCAIVNETPPGFEFGKTAMALTRLMKAKWQTPLPNGAPAASHRRVIPVAFRPGS